MIVGPDLMKPLVGAKSSKTYDEHYKLSVLQCSLFRKDATPVKIYGESSFIFPLLVAETFARKHYNLEQ